MIASAFIAWNLENIGLLIGGTVLGIVCIAAALGVLAQGSDGSYSVVFLGFAVFFFVFMCIVAPHMSTEDSRHHQQVFIDLPREYGQQLTVVDTSVRDHWVEFRTPVCGGHTFKFNNMRLIGGHYWLAVGVVDKYGNTISKPVAPAALKSICGTSLLVATS